MTARSLTTTDGVAETIWTGLLPSWDGVPLDVDVTVPTGKGCDLPLVVFGHGWSESKTSWEASTATVSAPNKSRWNSTWFASQGDVSLNFSMRGWHGSCGPDTSSAPAHAPAGLPAACTAPGRQYWVHLDDMRYEIRDAQTLVGKLVDAGLANPAMIVATGGSYGGGQTTLLTVLNDRTMCGGAAALSPDPCAGKQDGQTVSWSSPHGVPLHIAAGVAEYTWASLVNALIPNGRATTGGVTVNQLTTPIGVPIESYVDGLFADAYTPPALENGYLQPPTSTDTTADLPVWFATIQAGVNTVAVSAPVTSAITTQAVTALADYKSPLSPLVAPDAPVPLFQIQGLTDPLFRPVEALMLRDRLQQAIPGYPVTTEFGDVGHSYADNKPDDWARFNTDANAFVTGVLDGATPHDGGVTTTLTRCRVTAAAGVYHAAQWSGLAPATVTLTSAATATTTNASEGTLGAKTDPILNGGAPVEGLGRGCPLLPQVVTDPGTATWDWKLGQTVTLLGAPVLHATVQRVGPDAELDSRLWDIAPDGTEALIGRATYRLAGGASGTDLVTTEMSANAWRLPAGDTIRLELVGADAPYFQPDTIASTLTIAGVSLGLPVSAAPSAVTPVATEVPVTTTGGTPPGRTGVLPATGGDARVAIVGALMLLGALLANRRRHRAGRRALHR